MPTINSIFHHLKFLQFTVSRYKSIVVGQLLAQLNCFKPKSELSIYFLCVCLQNRQNFTLESRLVYFWIKSLSVCLKPKPEEALHCVQQLDCDLVEGQQWMWAMQLKKSLAADFLLDNIVWQICYVTPRLNLNLTLLHFSTKEPVFNDNGCSHNEEGKCAIYHGKEYLTFSDCSD